MKWEKCGRKWLQHNLVCCNPFCLDGLKKIQKKTLVKVVGRRRYVVKHNLITEVYLMTVMETTTCFGLYWPSSGCLGNLRASYMHARACGVEIPTYA